MAQHDYLISNGSGSAVRSDLNNALAAIVSTNSGTSEPTTTYAYQFWADTTAGVLKIRNGANNAWITLRELDGTLVIEAGTVSAPGLYFSGDTNTGIYSPGADQFAIATNGVERIKWGTSEVVFNDGGADYDFRIEGDTKPNLFLVDASADAVSFDGSITIANQNVFRFGDSDNSNWIGLRASATVASNVTFTLPAADGTANQVLTTNGSGALSFADRSRMVLATSVASTSGTSIDFTSIPSWVKRITVMFVTLSTNGSSPIVVRVGSGSFQSSGYDAQGWAGSDSSGVVTNGIPVTFGSQDASWVTTGSMTLLKYDNNLNQFMATGMAGFNSVQSNGFSFTGYTPVLSGALDRIRITTISGTDTFDAGTINILYEG